MGWERLYPRPGLRAGGAPERRAGPLTRALGTPKHRLRGATYSGALRKELALLSRTPVPRAVVTRPREILWTPTPPGVRSHNRGQASSAQPVGAARLHWAQLASFLGIPKDIVGPKGKGGTLRPGFLSTLHHPKGVRVQQPKTVTEETPELSPELRIFH